MSSIRVEGSKEGSTSRSRADGSPPSSSDISPESAFQVIDAGGQIVTPGLVDLHTHVFHKITYWGIDPDPVAARTGVTTWNDAGSVGAMTLPGFRDFVVGPAKVGITAFLNISSVGLVCDDYECANSALPGRRSVPSTRRAQQRSRARRQGANGEPRPLRRRCARTATACAACGRRMRAAAHDAHLVRPPTIDEVLPFLKPNDVLTHCFTGHPMKIVDDKGRLLEVAERAWESGVVMDVGHGTGSFSFETAEAVMAAGRKPDVISTDLHQLSVNGPAFDLPTTLSKFIHLGMSLREVVEAATARPAAVLGLEREVGTLQPGSRADIALFRLLQGDFPLQDIHGNVRHATQLLRNTATIVGGRRLELLPLPAGAIWTQEPIWPDVQIPFTEKQRQLRELGRTPDAMAAAAGEAR